jgi:hypothetical protein
MDNTSFLSYSKLRERLKQHCLMLEEVPTEASLSLPLPTLRFGVPGWAQFSAAAARLPGHPVVQDPPNRWWVVDARHGRMVLYALTSAYPFAADQAWQAETLPRIQASLAEYKAQLAEVEKQLETLAPLFFTGQLVEITIRQQFLKALLAYLPAPLHPQYRALVPDFFEWLAAA